jgi:two-component system NarL family sensor kinase
MRQPSWSGWASVRSHLPGWVGVPLLVAVVIMASLGWVILARGSSPADSTVTFPSAPYWSRRGVVVNELLPGNSGLQVGDCVVAVDGRRLEDLVRNGPARVYHIGDVVRYEVRRNGEPLNRDCSGPQSSIEITLTPYQFSSVLSEHASVLALACFMLALGAFLIAVRPRSGAPRALLVAAFLYPFGVTEWPFGTQVIDLASGPRLWPFVIGDIANTLFWGALLLLATSLPRRRLPPRSLVLGCFMLPLALYLLYLLITLPQRTSELGKLARLITVSLAAAYAVPILMVLALAAGYMSAEQTERRAAVRWVLIPLTLAVFAYFVLGQLPAAFTGRPLIPWTWLNGIFIVVLAAMTVSVVRNHLFEVQIVIRRWGLRIAALLAGVAGVLALWRLMIMPRTRPSDWLIAATAWILIAGLCIAIVLLNRILQRRLFGARADSDLMIAALSPKTTPVVTDESGLTATLDALMHALRLAFVQLDLTMPGTTALSLSRGAVRQPDRVLPLCAGKVHVGQLSLAVRPGLEPLGRADERLLDALAHVLASSAYNLGLQHALRKALAQAVTAREEERRRIRREIHDGIGPLLAAALLRTETAMELPPGCQAESLQKLHELQKTALIDVRSLVEGLRPPALDNGGLLGALQQHAEVSAVMGTQGPPTITFEVAGDLSVLPAAVEVAAYRIGQEAISNATKHAGAQRIIVRMSHTDSGLTLEIEDDGVGLAANNNSLGVGRISMTERATELGGWCTTEHSATGGTRVNAWLPILIEDLAKNAYG